MERGLGGEEEGGSPDSVWRGELGMARQGGRRDEGPPWVCSPSLRSIWRDAWHPTRSVRYSVIDAGFRLESRVGSLRSHLPARCFQVSLPSGVPRPLSGRCGGEPPSRFARVELIHQRLRVRGSLAGKIPGSLLVPMEPFGSVHFLGPSLIVFMIVVSVASPSRERWRDRSPSRHLLTWVRGSEFCHKAGVLPECRPDPFRNG